MNANRKNTRIYLDHSATTPVDQQVLEAMLPYFTENFGNASSVHGFGQEAKVALENARRQIASLINAEPGEIVFTSGGTEADNWAVKGTAQFFAGRKKHIITSRVEHQAVIYACRAMEKQGFEITYLPVDKFGMVSPEKVEAAIRDDTCLISIMHVNNELGTINPTAEIGAVAREREILFHTDAVQAFGKIPIDVQEMKVDLLSLSGHKIYGPKGVGALYMRKGTRIEKLLHGGQHERGRRAGTENVAGAVGLGKAAEICQQRMEPDHAHFRNLSDDFVNKVTAQIDDVHLNGHPERRLPGIVNFSFPGAASDSMLLSLDLKGIAVSNGSACTSGAVEPSHVMKALGLPKERTNTALRFSFGRKNTLEEVEITVDALKEIQLRLRKLNKKQKVLA